MSDREALGRIVWVTSHADEGAISATGANIIADAILAAGWRPPVPAVHPTEYERSDPPINRFGDRLNDDYLAPACKSGGGHGCFSNACCCTCHMPTAAQHADMPVADDDGIWRHAEKQGVGWSDAWRYFETNGYDMSEASAQYDEIETAHDDWCHWGNGCCGCKCGAVPFGTDDPSIPPATADHLTEPSAPGLAVAMMGTTDGGMIDQRSEIPIGEAYRLAAEYLFPVPVRVEPTTDKPINGGAS